jgi:hypothetical protein
LIGWLRGLFPGLLISGGEAGNRGAAISRLAGFEQSLEAIQVFVECTLGIRSEKGSNRMA